MRTGLRTWVRRRRHVRAGPDDEYLEARELTRLLHAEPAPLTSGAQASGPLHAAFVVPSFQRGSGGHTTIANLIRGLERRGHRCSVWIDDLGGRVEGGARHGAQRFHDWFGPFGADVHYGVGGWRGADVALATGWQTVARVLTLPTAARAYLVQDHEPEFFGTSAHRLWATDSYRPGFHAITAGPWLARLMRERYGLSATHFDLGVDGSIYRPLDAGRRDDVVLFYARPSTPRRAVPIALVALRELVRRRPAVEVWAFGHSWPPAVDFPVRHLGVLPADELARRYAVATVGLVLSMTNYSLVPQEMLACGLPCVELDTPSVVAAYGREGPVDVAPPDAWAIADAIERLLDDPALRVQRARQGSELAASRTWDAAVVQVEAGLRAALTATAG